MTASRYTDRRADDHASWFRTGRDGARGLSSIERAQGRFFHAGAQAPTSKWHSPRSRPVPGPSEEPPAAHARALSPAINRHSA